MDRKTQDRQIRIEFARRLIRENPSLGKDAINKRLREEYGVGLRRIYVARLKSTELYVKPSRVERRYQTLIKEKFLPTEARQLSQIPISSPAMKAYRAERKAMVRTGRPVRAAQLKELYRLEGHFEKGRILPLARLRSFLRREEFLPWEEVPEKRPRLTAEQRHIYERLRDAGFLPFEAARIAGAPSMPAAFNTVPMQQAMLHRTQWIEWLRGQGWTRKQIRREIEMYYRRDTKRDPWDFIRQEYRPKGKVRDFQLAAARRKQVEEAHGRTAKLYRGRRSGRV